MIIWIVYSFVCAPPVTRRVFAAGLPVECADIVGYSPGPTDPVIISGWEMSDPACRSGSATITVKNVSEKTIVSGGFLIERVGGDCKPEPPQAARLVLFPKRRRLASTEAYRLPLPRDLVKEWRAESHGCKGSKFEFRLYEVVYDDGTRSPPDLVGPALRKRFRAR
jgi:hypothetical protein